MSEVGWLYNLAAAALFSWFSVQMLEKCVGSRLAVQPGCCCLVQLCLLRSVQMWEKCVGSRLAVQPGCSAVFNCVKERCAVLEKCEY